MFDKSLLQRVQFPVRTAQALNGQHLAAIGRHRQHQARQRRMAIQVHRASATLAQATAILGTGQPQTLAQHVQQQLVRRDVQLVGHAVHGQSDEMLLCRAKPQGIAMMPGRQLIGVDGLGRRLYRSVVSLPNRRCVWRAPGPLPRHLQHVVRERLDHLTPVPGGRTHIVDGRHLPRCRLTRRQRQLGAKGLADKLPFGLTCSQHSRANRAKAQAAVHDVLTCTHQYRCNAHLGQVSGHARELDERAARPGLRCGEFHSHQQLALPAGDLTGANQKLF